MLFSVREQLTIGNFDANLNSVIEHEIKDDVTRYRNVEKQVSQEFKHWANSTVEAKYLIKIVDLSESELICDVVVKTCRIKNRLNRSWYFEDDTKKSV